MQEIQEMQVQLSGRSTEEESGNPLQYSFLENPVDRGAMSTASQRVGNDGSNLAHTTIVLLGVREWFEIICY